MFTSPNRLVAIATPLLFAPLAGAVTAFAAKHAPGVEIDQGQMEAIFIAGATIALAKSSLWLKGWQNHEKSLEVLPADALEPANDMDSLNGGGDFDAGDLPPDAGMPTEAGEDVDPLGADDDLDEEAELHAAPALV
jgi:hypothetical protein